MLKIYYFSAPWCSPCKQYGPIVERVCQQTGVELTKHDAESDVAQQFAIRGVPTVVVMDSDHEVLAVKQGVMTENGLRTLIDSVLV